MTRTTKHLFPVKLLLKLLILVTACGVISERSAVADTITVGTAADVVLVQGLRYADGGGQCINIVYGQWTDVPGTLSALLHYKASGSDSSISGTPPYHNEGRAETAGSAGYPAAAPGTNRLELGFNSMAGGSPSREEFKTSCDELAASLTALVDKNATVDLTLERPEATQITSQRGTATLGASREAILGTLYCATNGACVITAPSNVRVKISDKNYTLKVTAPTELRGGSREKVKVTFPRKAADALKGKAVTVRVGLATNNLGLTKADGVVKRTVRGP